MVATLGKPETAAPQEAPKKSARPPRTPKAKAARGSSMEKWMCWGAIAAGAIMLLLFILDIAAGIPFSGPHWVLDISGILAAAAIIFMGADTLREFK
jgi:hypothetical protein